MHIKNKSFLVSVFFVISLIWTPLIHAQAQNYEDLLGTWDVETENGSYTFVFKFYMDGETLAGKFTGSSGETDMQDLTYENNKVIFSVDVNGMIIDFVAEISGNELTGMLSLQYGESNITGKKRT